MKKNFIVANSLKKFAISSSQKWKQLYQNTKAKQSEELKDKDAVIKFQENKISTQKNIIDTISNTVLDKEQWIKKLSDQTVLQQQKFEDKVKIELQLEESIKRQIDFIKSQDDKIISRNIELEKQQFVIDK